MPVSGKKKTFLDIFPVPEFLLLSTAGVVITDEGVRFVELKKGFLNRGFKLSYLKHQNSSDPASTLKILAARYGNRFVSAVLPEEKSYIFTASIDKVEEGGIRDAVAFIIEENVPVSLKESVFDYEVIDMSPDGRKIKLAVAVVPRNVIEAQAAILDSAGLMPISFDLESRAIARAVVPRGDKRTYLLINLSHSKAGFYVVEDEVVQFSTTVSYGGGEDESSPNLADLKAEMRKVMIYWDARVEELSRDKNSDESVRKIEATLVCGTHAGKKDFLEKLMQDTSIAYNIADIWVNVSHKNHVPKAHFGDHLDYASAIGLILSRDK